MKKILFACMIIVLSVSSSYARGKETVDNELVSIGNLSGKTEDIFDDVKTSYVKKESQFAIASVRIDFATKATYKARYEKAAVHGGPKASINIILDGISDAIMQEIADTAGRIYEKEMAAAGLSLLSYDDYSKNKYAQKILKTPDDKNAETKLKLLSDSLLARTSGTTHIKSFSSFNRPLFDAAFAGMSLYKLQNELKCGSVSHDFSINFSTYKINREKEYSGNWVTTTVEVEAIPIIALSSESTWISSGAKMGFLRNKKIWVVDKNFVTGTEESEEGTIKIKADPEIFKAACIELLEKNIKLTVQHIKALSK